MENVIILGTSLLSGIATFDGISKSFPPATNAAIWIGQKAVAGTNGLLAMALTATVGYAVAACIEVTIDKSKGNKEEVNE